MLSEAIAAIAALGGLTAATSAAAWWLNRKSDKRKGEAAAERDQFETIRDRLEYEEQENSDLMRRNRELSQRVMDVEGELIASEREKGDLRVELERVRCNDQPCPWRTPPNASTPAMPEVGRDQWHASRLPCAACAVADCPHRQARKEEKKDKQDEDTD